MSVALAKKIDKIVLTPTPEQAVIISSVKGNPLKNYRVLALAGAAKTTTLEMIGAALPQTPILAIAFNKRIADEMAKRLPSNVKASTINSVGHGAWGSARERKLTLTKDKVYDITSGLIGNLPRYQRESAYDTMAEIMKIIRLAKTNGYIPAKSVFGNKSLFTEDQFFGMLEEEPDAYVVELVNKALIENIRLAYDAQIDFDDQIYCSTLLGGVFPKFPLVLVDEAQDLNILNHKMIQLLVTQRIIAVGDPLQSIYAFRGALTNSMDALAETFHMEDLTLSVSFRCPQAVVEAARFRAPHMQWAPGAKVGTVEELKRWTAQDIPDGSAIVCRNNAPLMSAALRLLRAGRGVKLVGTDLGPQLIKALKKLGPSDMTQEKMLEAIAQWEMEKLRRSRNSEITTDKADCLRVFAKFGSTLSEAIAYAEHIFAAAGPVQLLSIHKAKGLEWNTVYFLDAWRIPSLYARTKEALEQEFNAKYVAITRAKENLYYINLDDFAG